MPASITLFLNSSEKEKQASADSKNWVAQMFALKSCSYVIVGITNKNTRIKENNNTIRWQRTLSENK